MYYFNTLARDDIFFALNDKLDIPMLDDQFNRHRVLFFAPNGDDFYYAQFENKRVPYDNPDKSYSFMLPVIYNEMTNTSMLIVADMEFTKLWNKIYNTSENLINRELYIIPTSNDSYTYRLF